VGDHYNARAFKDLAEFIDQLFFLCSIHSFTPIKVPNSLAPALVFAGQRTTRQSVST
jgi:hypothetical protein